MHLHHEAWAAVPITMMLFMSVACAAFEPPANDGYVTLGEGVPQIVLNEEQEKILEQSLQQYETDTSNQIAVLIVSSLDGYPIEDAAVETGRKWGVGSEENDNGILLLVSYEDREMFLAVGYGLEGAVPDIIAKGIVDRDLTPQFQEGDYYEGIVAAIDSLQKHIGGEYTADRYAENFTDSSMAWLVFICFILFDVLASFLARTKSWWMGGIVGAILGTILTVMFGWWLSIPALVIVGLLFDYLVSKMGYKRMRSRGIGGWGGGRGGSNGGFGGFGGGSFGGGGARGRW